MTRNLHKTMQETPKNVRTLRAALVVGVLSALAMPLSCVEDDVETEDAAADEAPAVFRNEPGEGTGSASWTVVHSGGSLVFSVSISDGVMSAPSLSGPLPALSALPINVTNSDGEPLSITQVTIQGRPYRKYSGTFEMTVDQNESQSQCSQCWCQVGGGGPCVPIQYDYDCSSGSGWCGMWACSGGGSGVEPADVDFTATPGAPG